MNDYIGLLSKGNLILKKIILHEATLNSKANRPQFSHFSWHYFKRVGMESKFSTSMIGFHIHTAQIHLVFNSRFH